MNIDQEKIKQLTRKNKRLTRKIERLKKTIYNMQAIEHDPPARCKCGGWGCLGCCGSKEEIRGRQGIFG